MKKIRCRKCFFKPCEKTEKTKQNIEYMSTTMGTLALI